MSSCKCDSTDPNTPAVTGDNNSVSPTPTNVSTNGRGVQGTSASGIGVLGQTVTGFAVYGNGGSQKPGGIGVIGHSDNNIGVSGESVGGDAVVGNSTSGRGVVGHSSSNAGVVGDSDGFDGVWGLSRSPQHAGVSAHNDSAGPTAFGLWAKGTPAGHFEGDVEVTGDIRLLNADCAEDFDICGTEIEPGTVMVIDTDGRLLASQGAYDKRVAGVISGAGNLKPGIVLGSQRSENKRVPIALLGTVYCKVDARSSAIEVGDLLTTSPTPGHAMKAMDPVKAFGAVIGKALRPQPSGNGLIPILIALQ